MVTYLIMLPPILLIFLCSICSLHAQSWIQPEPMSQYGNQSSYQVFGKTYHVLKEVKAFHQVGKASWYGHPFHGRKTSNHETFDMFQISAAHRELPLPSYVRVTRLDNKKSIIVRVNDRGPFHPHRIIDLSYAAAKKLGILESGISSVSIDLITPPKNR